MSNGSVNPFERLRRICQLLMKDDEKDAGKLVSESLGFKHPHHWTLGYIGFIVSFPLEQGLMKFLPRELREAIEAEKLEN